ncbi:unnamed protein product [Adineta steineri]|uniref:Uncharacterized protein n=1 Tax=Adineta steineri TaxID=433720 RepID=A0A814TXB7_9BILA|nr:unnamed protein product [Adineta steineri]CAF1280144.1 unnamed protein product [Adineta steineri]CAF4140459.1 unnamed protein product [Adineta steineri]
MASATLTDKEYVNGEHGLPMQLFTKAVTNSTNETTTAGSYMLKRLYGNSDLLLSNKTTLTTTTTIQSDIKMEITENDDEGHDQNDDVDEDEDKETDRGK